MYFTINEILTWPGVKNAGHSLSCKVMTYTLNGFDPWVNSTFDLISKISLILERCLGLCLEGSLISYGKDLSFRTKVKFHGIYLPLKCTFLWQC